ncbi:TPA: helix-turn-helix domain-containing protein, partial [Citrobacter braakii]
VPVSTRDSKMNELIEYLRRNLDKPHDLDSLAGFVSMSRRTLTRHFIKATGTTVGDWLNTERLQRSQELLETTNISIERVSEMVGFQSPISFRQSFKAKFSVSPSEWRIAFRGPAPVDVEVK